MSSSKSPDLPITTRVAIAVLSAASDLSRRRNGTVNRLIFSLLDRGVPPNPVPVNGVRTTDVTVDPARDLYFRLFLPSSSGGQILPTIVFFHGGGFAFLSPASRAYDIVCRRLAKKLNAVLVSVNYRRSPEHRCPAPYVDGVDVLRFLDAESSHQDLAAADLGNCFLMGDSAGGNIAHHVGKEYAKHNDWKQVRLSGSILIQPYFGGVERTEAELRLTNAPLVSVERTDWLWKAFLPEGADRDHEAANAFGPKDRTELGEGFPKATMVVVGGWDPLQDWQRRYAEGLCGRGKEVKLVEYENAVHAFYVLLPGAKEAKLLFQEMAEFVQSHLSR